jgi:glycosyltransferase involved in cell wall biosynthesis
VLFSIVIPAYNAGAYVRGQLDALARQVYSEPFEVLVVDNMSTDGTADVAAQYADRLNLRLLTASARRSASHARNVGIAQARGEFIVFVDADDVVDDSLLAAYESCADVHRIMGGPYEETLLNDPKVAAWRYRLTKDGLPIAFGLVPFFLMGNAAIHRSVFDEIGTFDEALTHGGEEVDFSARAHLAGYEVGWVPNAIVYYRHRTTLRALSRQWFDFGRATTYVYARYREQASLPRTTPSDTAKTLWEVVPHVVDLALGNRRRGQWVRSSSFYAGEALESLRQRVWHLG